MGRPLNKKFFGNRNVGSASTTADDKIGGEGVESISVATAGSFVVTNTYKNFPLLNIGAPNLPTGVQATADVVFELNTVTYSSGGATGYLAGLSTSITGMSGGAVVNITINGGGAVNGVNLTGGNRGEFRRGDFDGTGITTHQVLQAPNAGTDLQITVTYRVKSITILEKGSGYTALPVLSWSGHTFTGQTTPSGNTPALTTDSGFVGSATNQENAISITAWVPATADNGRISGNGTSAVAGDIVRQSGSSKYIVRTAQGVGRVKLVAATPAKGEATIIATDSDGGTYYVTELRGHKAHIIKGDQTGTQFTTGTGGIDVPWTFNGTSGTKVVDSQPYLAAGVNVKIANA